MHCYFFLLLSSPFQAVHFIEILVGPKCSSLAVDNPAQYGFTPDSLLTSMVYFAVRLAEQPGFVRAVSTVSLQGGWGVCVCVFVCVCV